MNPEAPTAVDDYLAPRVAPHDAALDAARTVSAEAGLPEIAVSANQGKMLQVLALTVGATRILEIGTLGGYSTIWMARALPEGGRLVTLEADPHHAEVANVNLTAAGVADRVEVRLGKAIESLPELSAEEIGPFDLTFIDADKPSIPDYFDWAIRLSRPGGLIVVDNVVRRGELANPESDDPAVIGCQQLIDRLKDESRVAASVVQTVGSKGHDGFVLATVL